MPNYTPNYNIEKPLDNENADITIINDNMDIIDTALTPAADPAQAPSGNGPGKLVQWVGWLANRIKAITGKANWWDNPATTLEAANTHINASAPHAGHETPAGAQAKVDAHANAPDPHPQYAMDTDLAALNTTVNSHMADNTAHGVNTKVNKSGDTMTGKLTSALTAQQIEYSGTAGTIEVMGDATKPAAMTFHRSGAFAVNFGLDTDNQLKVGGWSMGAVKHKIWHSGNDGAGSGLDADTVDGIHFRVNAGRLQYDDGTGWKDISLAYKSFKVLYASLEMVANQNWTQVVNITGAGFVHAFTYQCGFNYGAQYIEFRITVDGTLYDTVTPNNNSSDVMDYDSKNRLYLHNLKFDSQFKIEFRNTYAGVVTAHAHVQYSI